MSHAERLYNAIAAAGSAGLLATDAAIALERSVKQVQGNAQHLVRHCYIERVGKPNDPSHWRATGKAPTWGRHTTVLLKGSDRSRREKQIERIRAQPHAEPKVTVDRTVYPTAKWQQQPDAPLLGFSRLPLGATLSGGRV